MKGIFSDVQKEGCMNYEGLEADRKGLSLAKLEPRAWYQASQETIYLSIRHPRRVTSDLRRPGSQLAVRAGPRF